VTAHYPDDALRAQVDPDLWFPENGVKPVAKRICAACEVRAECLAAVLADDTLRGIWGGTTEAERKKMRRRAA